MADEALAESPTAVAVETSAPSVTHRIARVAVWLGSIVLALVLLSVCARGRGHRRGSAHPRLLEQAEVMLVAVVFGWAGGKQLVMTSYTEARSRARCPGTP